MDKNIKFKIASNWFKILQEIICYEIIKLEGKNKSFEIKKWKRSKKLDEGGGESRILRNGKICEVSNSEQLFENPNHEYTKELLRLMPKIETIYN